MVDTKYNKRFIYKLCCCFLFFLILSAIIFPFDDSNYVDAAPFPTTTFSTNNGTSTNLIQQARGNNNLTPNFWVNTNYLANNQIVYSMIKNLEQPRPSESFNPADSIRITDKGILYIISHGYNKSNTINTVFTTNKFGTVPNDTAKEYITQIALWLYIYEQKAQFTNDFCIITQDTYSSCDFYNSATASAITASEVRNEIKTAASVSGFNYLNYIIELVDSAKAYPGNSPSSLNKITIDAKNYQFLEDKGSMFVVTEQVKISANKTDDFLGYTVSLDDPNNYGAYLVDTNNKKITNMNNVPDTFKVVVPLQEELENMDLSSVTVHITGKFVNMQEEYAYAVGTTSDGKTVVGPSNKKTDRFAKILLVDVPIITNEISFSLENIVKVNKIDADTKEILIGATLVIKNLETNREVVSMVSTLEPKYIYLEKGGYSLCETEAPEGYLLNEECIDFSVDGSKSISLTMENTEEPPPPPPPPPPEEPPEEPPVPNTKLTISKIIYIIGGIGLVAGIGFVGNTMRKKRNTISLENE